MDEEDAERILAHLEKYTEEVTSSKEKALQALIDAGIVKENGELTDLYKD